MNIDMKTISPPDERECSHTNQPDSCLPDVFLEEEEALKLYLVILLYLLLFSELANTS